MTDDLNWINAFDLRYRMNPLKSIIKQIQKKKQIPTLMIDKTVLWALRTNQAGHICWFYYREPLISRTVTEQCSYSRATVALCWERNYYWQLTIFAWGDEPVSTRSLQMNTFGRWPTGARWPRVHSIGAIWVSVELITASVSSFQLRKYVNQKSNVFW